MKTLQEIYGLNGIEFITALLEDEKKRFDTSFLKGSVLEDINNDFGIFPNDNPYPVYFSGDITKPKGRFVFIGINPAYDKEWNRKENEFLNKQGIFKGYTKLFLFFKTRKSGLLPYFANIAGFLKRLYGITEVMDWDWFQEHFINLEFIPYHSKDANGVRINNIRHYRERYFEVLLKLIKHINPTRPIFINGFSNFERYLKDPVFHDAITFKKEKNIWIGTIDGKYTFIGLPFLTRVAGGKDQLVANVRNCLDQQNL